MEIQEAGLLYGRKVVPNMKPTVWIFWHRIGEHI
jgi:hypothetical protein